MEPVSEELSCKFKNMAIVCAILVVFIHIPLGRLESGSVLWVFDMLVRWGIAQIAVPFFFVASGYFLAGHIGEDGWWKREILKRIRTLLVPFILWNAIFILYGMTLATVADLVAHRAFGTSFAYAKNPGYFLLGFDPLAPPPLGSMWYIRTLLLLTLVSPVIVWVLKRFPRAFILSAWVLSLVAGANNWDRTNALPLCVEEIGRGLVFFAVGIFLRRNSIRVAGRKLWAWSSVIALALLAVHMGQDVGQGYTGMSREASLGIVAIPFMLYAVWGMIPAKPWAKGFTSLAFPCYLMHAFVINMLNIGISALVKLSGLPQSVHEELHLWIPLVLAVPVTLLLGYALHRCFPKTAGVLFGGR